MQRPRERPFSDASAAVSEERVLLAHRAGPFRIDITADHALGVTGGGQRLAEWIEDDGIADVREPVAGSDAVNADDVRLVFDRPGPKQRRPVRTALPGPVGDDDVAVGAR